MTKDRVILGEGCIYSADSSETGLNNNVLVCGSSGCGKTMSVSEPRLLETRESSVIATVTKRRIINKYKELFLQRGYDVQDLDFVNPERGNIGYDPLRFVRNCQDITFLAESIVKANPRKDNSTADPYWDEAAVSLLSAEIAYVLMLDEDATFADVLEMHDGMDFKERNSRIETSYDSRFERLEKEDPGSFAVSCWKSFHLLPIKTASCVFGTLNTTIDTIFAPQLREMMAMKNKVDFEKLASRKTILFITSSPVNPALNCFINMFYGHVFKQLFEFAEDRPDGTLPLPVHVLCDDFATGSRILNFAEYISIFREKKISVTLLVQSESQLESMYGPSDTTTIINNCDSYLYMGGMDLMTARNISQRLNAPLDEILYMPLGQEVLFRRGQRPVVTRRYNVREHDTYRRITETYEKEVEGGTEKQGVRPR